jgi:phage host-nuclease inhibitor protein Gam
MSNQRTQRLDALQKAVDQYIKSEKDRITNEVKVMQAIVNGRGGAVAGKQAIQAVAYNDLAEYLSGD